MPLIRIAQTDDDIRRCLPALLALRPHLTEQQAFDQIKIQQQEGFTLAFVDLGNDEAAPAAAGYRIMTLLYSGRTLYIDDLSTLPSARGKGYAGALIDFIVAEARNANCNFVTLDSGQNAGRYDAHRLYLNKRFNIVSHHFVLNLK